MERKPEWLKIKYRANYNMKEVEAIVKDMSLHTVCDEASCPNRIECYGKKTATFMILGKYCTRNCQFCNVNHEEPMVVDKEEPDNVAKAVETLSLKHVVITSVTRDDLEDGGAFQFVAVINALKRLKSPPVIEVLIPDFRGNKDAISKVVEAKPDIIGHNIETIERLYDEVRPEALYDQSLEVLRFIKEKDASIYTKSGIMLGLGETPDEVEVVLKDLRGVGCEFATIGQYLAPSKEHHKVVAYVEPSVFDALKEKSMELGFAFVASGPFVRSSYQAHEAIEKMNR